MKHDYHLFSGVVFGIVFRLLLDCVWWFFGGYSLGVTANRDGRQRWAEDTIENVKRREKKGNGLTRLLLVGGFRDFKLT